jgi:hypothetical protein
MISPLLDVGILNMTGHALRSRGEVGPDLGAGAGLAKLSWHREPFDCEHRSS